MDELAERLAVLAGSATWLPRAEQLAAELELPCLGAGQPREFPGRWLLVVDESLWLTPGGRGGAGPVRADFVSGKLGFRLGRQEPLPDLARAVGAGRGIRPEVWDLTAGLGRDAFVLARHGCRVWLHERNPLVYRLLEDGLRRARAASAQQPALAELLERMTLRSGDAAELLTRARPPVAYIDPMFPPRGKPAKAKKEMQVFQALVGEDRDAAQLLELALARSRYRVVVKRPRLAEPLGRRQPDHQLGGKSVRYDVYVLQKLPG